MKFTFAYLMATMIGMVLIFASFSQQEYIWLIGAIPLFVLGFFMFLYDLVLEGDKK